jgi:hypothetical protein
VLDAAGNQIGYLSRARFVWNATLPRSLDQFGVHFDWADASGGGGGTAFAYDQGALCLTCNGECWPPSIKALLCCAHCKADLHNSRLQAMSIDRFNSCRVPLQAPTPTPR